MSLIFDTNSEKKKKKKQTIFGSNSPEKSVLFGNLSNWLIWTLKMLVVLSGSNSLKVSAMKKVLTIAWQ